MKQSKTLFVGRNAEGERVWVTIELRERGDGGPYTSVDHTKITNGYTELAISGSVASPRARTVHACGQIRPELAHVVDFRGSAFTADTVAELGRIWDRWHLNGLTAACSHMTNLPEDKRYEARQHITCPKTGYAYGSAWLVDLLPMSVLATVRGFLTLPSGDVPSYV